MQTKKLFFFVIFFNNNLKVKCKKVKQCQVDDQNTTIYNILICGKNKLRIRIYHIILEIWSKIYKIANGSSLFLVSKFNA